jgi:RNA ligase (TIGR02306 family)
MPMSMLVVAVRNISKVWTHPNADKLALAAVEGLDYQFCVPKSDNLAPGDPVVYFPIDSMLPDELSTRMGVKNYLAGKDKRRLKTVRLRDQVSQGIVARPEGILGPDWRKMDCSDLAPQLGITKYEPPEIPCHGGLLKPMPDGVGVYDLENAENFPAVVALLMPARVCVTEKLEGTNYSVTIVSDGRIFVNQRNHTIEPVEGAEHFFWKAARENGHLDVIRKIQEHNFPKQQVTLRGELVGPGIQGNMYGLKKIEAFFFDIRVDDAYMPVATWLDVCSIYGLKTAPVLASDIVLSEWLGGKTPREASDGQSILANVPREGFVIKPMTEGRCADLGGRLILKQRSPAYLAGSDS